MKLTLEVNLSDALSASDLREIDRLASKSGKSVDAFVSSLLKKGLSVKGPSESKKKGTAR